MLNRPPIRRRFRAGGRYVVLTLAALVLCILWAPIVLRWMGRVLVSQDLLKPAAAVVVLGGGAPFREMEAAEIYRSGWASTVVVSRGRVYEEDLALRQLGIHIPEGWEVSREVLSRSGVPASSIVVTGEGVEGTIEELQAVFRTLDPHNVPVILVTSKFHALRTRLTWNGIARGRSEAIVRTARFDPFDPDRWWKERRFALSVVREYLGLFNYWAGFPVPARASAD